MGLEYLTIVARKALDLPWVSQMIKRLKMEILCSDEPFIWEVLPEKLVGEVFSAGIRSGWVFVLKPNCKTPTHCHPNSVQYTAVLEGSGRIRIGGEEKEIRLFDPSCNEAAWYIIDEGVPHMVITGDAPMVVISFHTCPSDELLEVETRSGRRRIYVKRQ